MERQLKLKLREPEGWRDEEWLARFVRTLEAGRRRAPRWQLSTLDDGWEARADAFDRTSRIRLFSGDEREWTLAVESGPPEAAPATLRGGEWWVGAALGAAAFVVGRERLGTVLALTAAFALFIGCGILPHLLRNQRPIHTGESPDQADEELLERVRRGAEAFAGFELVTHEWREP